MKAPKWKRRRANYFDLPNPLEDHAAGHHAAPHHSIQRIERADSANRLEKLDLDLDWGRV